MGDTSRHDFKLAQMADDLYDYTLKLCGKQIEEFEEKQSNEEKQESEKKKTYRFPLYLYPNYVSRMLNTAGDIHEDIIIANESRDVEKRLKLQDDVIGKCVYLNHLTKLARDRGWISNKQLNDWRTLTNGVFWSTWNWMRSDIKRKTK